MKKISIKWPLSAFILALLSTISCSSSDELESTNSPDGSNAQRFTAVSGASHTMAIKENGTLWVCGYNANGELGNGTTYSGWLPPAQLGSDTNWKSVCAAEAGFSSMALKNDGSLWAWGTSYFNAMGIGDVESTLVPVRVGLDNDWKFIDCTGNFALALKNDGTLWGAGFSNCLGSPWAPEVIYFTQLGNATWKEVSAGQSHALGIKSDGTLWSWGFNNDGQLGNGSLATDYGFHQVGNASDWKQINASGSRSMAIKNDGSLWAWGQNNYGQLGLGTTINVSVPTRVGTENSWKVIKTGNINSFAVKTDGSLWGWGNFTEPGIGYFAETDEAAQSPVLLNPGNDWDTVFEGTVLYAKKANGEIWCWGTHLVLGQPATTDMPLGQVRPLVWE